MSKAAVLLLALLGCSALLAVHAEGSHKKGDPSKFPDVTGGFHANKPGEWEPLKIVKPVFVKDAYAAKPERERHEKKQKWVEEPVYDYTTKPNVVYEKPDKPVFVKDAYAAKPEVERHEKKEKWVEEPVYDYTTKPNVDYEKPEKPVFEKDAYAAKPEPEPKAEHYKYKEEPVPDLSEKYVYQHGYGKEQKAEHKAAQKAAKAGAYDESSNGY